MTLSMSFKSKLIPHRHRGGKGYGYAYLLTLGMESSQWMRHQEIFLKFSNIERRTGRKSITLNNDMDEGWKE